MKNKFDSEPVYNEKYLKHEIKPFDGKINTNFPYNGDPTESFHCVCLSVILTDSFLKCVKTINCNCFWITVNVL